MNLRELSENLGLEEDEYMELIQLFIETGMSDIKKLKSTIEAANAEKAVNIGHSFKGAALNLGLMEFFEIAKVIENTARDGQLKKTAHIVQALQKKLKTMKTKFSGS